MILYMHPSYCRYLAAKNRAKQVVNNTKEYAVAHQSQLKCVAATTVVVGLTARVAGFNAGYQFAQAANITTAV